MHSLRTVSLEHTEEKYRYIRISSVQCTVLVPLVCLREERVAQRVVGVVLEGDRRARRPLGVFLAEALARTRCQLDLLAAAQLRQQDPVVLAART